MVELKERCTNFKNIVSNRNESAQEKQKGNYDGNFRTEKGRLFSGGDIALNKNFRASGLQEKYLGHLKKTKVMR